MINIERLLERIVPAINFLRVSNEKYLPGSIIDVDNHDSREGHIKEILADWAESKWELDYPEGNIIIGETLSGESNIDSNVNVLGIVKAKVGTDSSYSIQCTLNEVATVEFLNTSKLELEIALNTLKKNNRKLWRNIKRDMIVTEAFFANNFSVTFKKGGNVMSEAEVKTNFNISADVAIDWKANGVIEITNNKKVPFGVRGLIVR